MKSIQVQLTTDCNERCFMCRKYTWNRKEILLTNLIEKINKYKDCTFTFSGGDPLSYSHLKELNDILSRNNIVYQIFTNMNYELTEDMKTTSYTADTLISLLPTLAMLQEHWRTISIKRLALILCLHLLAHRVIILHEQPLFRV